MQEGFCRTLVEIIGWRHTIPEGNFWILDLPSWNSRRWVELHEDKAPNDLRIGGVYIVQVNAGVDDPKDLRFHDWEPAPEPLPESELL